MFGLAILFVFVIYLLISIGIVWLAIKWAQSNDIRGWKWGVPVGVFMFMTVFWDLIPVYAVHAYQCKNNAGFSIYKTLDEWKQENPGVIETLNPDPEKSSIKAYWVKTDSRGRHYQLPDGTELVAIHGYKGKHLSTRIKRSDGTEGYWLNQRFAWFTKYEKVWHIVHKTDERIVDIKTGEIIAREVDFSASAGRLYNANKLSDYKIWFEARSCFRDEDRETKWLVNGEAFSSLESKLSNLGDR
jgi:hypothetical protein